MPKLVLTLSSIIIIISIKCATFTNGVTIDNTLVTSRHDCFERIAIGAMLPFEKTFRTSETNSVKLCQELCEREGDQCQTFSLGITVRGNGTCQLSSQVIDTTHARPVGTIFDPDFDLYARRNDCVTDPNTTPFSGNNVAPGFGLPQGFEPTPTFPASPSSAFSDEPSSIPPSPLPPSLPPTTTTIFTQPQPSTTNENPMFPSSLSTTMDLETSQPTQFIDRPSTTPETVGTTRYEDRFPTTYRRPSPPITQTTEKNSPYPPTTMGGNDRYPPTTMDNTNRYPPTTNQDSTNQYGSGERYPLKDRYPEPYPERETTRPASYPMYGDDRDKPQDRPVAYPLYGDRDPPARPNSRPNYNAYPNYDYPMLYEKNYPMPNEQNGQYPNLYAQNVPPLKVDYYRPSRPETSYDYNDRNNYYNNVDRYGLRPSTVGTGGGGSSSTGSSSSSSSGGGNGYDNRPIQTHQNPDRPDPTHPSNINTQDGYNTRPTSSSSSSGGGGGSTNGYDTQRPDSGNRGPSYHITDAPIEVYFNPESYYNIKPQSSGGGNIGGTINNGGSGGDLPNNEYRPNTGGGGGGGSGGYRPPAINVEACFRRVLAGKRISPQWVRRTLSCERIEDCQRECGEEKRFTCEGFNYRIDTTGNGQGLCELIEVPLSEMDLYSSPHNRDANLLRHPDYDYYERDRNASPGCSRPPTGCVDCAYLKPYRPYRPVAPLPPIGTSDHYRPSYQERQPQPEYNYRPQTTAIDKYRPPYYEQRPSPVSSQSGYSTFDYHNSQYYQSGNKYGLQRPTYPSDLDRYDPHRPDYRPGQGEIQIAGGGYGGGNSNSYLPRPDYNYRPANNYQDRDRDRDRIGSYQKPSQRPYVPYSINQQDSWGVYGGNYGGGYGGGYSTSNTNTYGSKGGQDYWGIRNPLKRVDSAHQFNYSDLGKNRYSQESDNNVWNYPGSRYNYDDKRKVNYGSLWTRRPGPDECSVKSSEGFRLHKGVIRHVYNAPTIRECEQMCNNEAKFKCQTYSYRYTAPQENCLLCDRPYSLLDYYTDLEPDRDYDVYSMSDDKKICNVSPKLDRTNGPQCFFRAIDTNRFFKSIIRDSLNVRSIGECEMECIKTNKFTCRAFSFRYGSVTPGSPIADNCQLSDWPVKDMNKDRHLIYDNAFDVFERASYGHGCEIRPIIDTKHQKLCYLGYGSPARLLSSAIKKVISVPTELDCKTECTRYRENTLFKCFAFSFGSHKSSYNCEMSDLDQSELKLDIHYAHSQDRDYWLFAWNPFDWTCRDRVTTIGGGGGAGNRVNNDRRLDIFRDPGEQQTWRHFTVSGKPCRKGTQCDRNLISGFYSCELEGGEIGAWDYCCRDDHPCGYTQGFEYPWCFVGDGRDQWRKCSDHYFPANDYLLSSGSNKIPTKTPTIQTNIQQRPPRPGGLSSAVEDKKGRIWPITYLYIDGPPNSTELSNAIDCKKEIC